MRDTFADRRPSGRPLPFARSDFAKSDAAASRSLFGTAATTRVGSWETSNSVISLTPLFAPMMLRQYRSRPTPNGDTTPIPVIATPAFDTLFL